MAVEMPRPARAFFNGTSLLPLSRKAAFDLFSADAALEKDAAGYTSYLNGIGAYYETSRKAESVIGFAPGYYD